MNGSLLIEPVRAATPISYESYGDVLEEYVNDSGLVDYAGLKINRGALDTFVKNLADLDNSAFAAFDEKEKIALWINAYNALTLRAIIDHFPIEPSKVKSLVFPRNSIRQIPGVWDELKFDIMGRSMSLNEIEHEVLRAQFREPRIHMALVCASIGCPPLRKQPFRGDALDRQLDDQTRRFLEHPRNFRIDRDRKVIHLSSIFDWFGEDFAGFNEEDDIPGRRSRKKQAVLKFIKGYVNGEDAAYISKGKFKVSFLLYDWSLNEQEAGGS
jgi:hypothetical protein